MRRGIAGKVGVLVAVLALVAAACTRQSPEDEEAQPQRSLLEVVVERGTLRCGVNATVPGFGFDPGTGVIEGFDIDFCKGIAAAVFDNPDPQEGTHYNLVPIDADARFAALQAGEYDVLVRNTTWTSSRDGAEGVSFAHVNFYDGQGMMVRSDSGFRAVEDMDGTDICVTAGTTTEGNLADYAEVVGIDINARTFESNDEIRPAFVAGRCDGWTSDSSQLAGLRSAWPEGEGGPEALTVLPDIMSKEPLAPAVLDGDSDWYDAVNWVVNGIILAEELGVTSENVQDEAANPSNPNIAALLGAPGEEGAPLDSGLGLEVDYMVNVLQAVGNYGEIFERHVGPDTPLGLERGFNDLWTRGGLQYAYPFR
jgi:general L-amino acid transport system substrate-binding protein